jgi:choline-sulfatase
LEKPRHRFSEKGNSQDFLNRQRQAYDEHLAYVDEQFARLFENLKNNGMLENTWLIFTSDHGEMFERGVWGHGGKVLYQPVIHIPLLIFQPGQTKRQDIYDLTSSVDLLPTLCQILGQPQPSWVEGQVLPPFNPQVASQRSIFAIEAKQNPSHGPLLKGTLALLKGNYKLIHYANETEGNDELYNLELDPEEMEDLSTIERSVTQELRQELNDKLIEVAS